ncbi:MAG: SPFH domain-containing protein [Pirellulales bacterium]
MFNEKVVAPRSGWMPLAVIVLAIFALLGTGILVISRAEAIGVPLTPILIVGHVLAIVICIVLLCGLTAVGPNEPRVLTLFGVYKGSVTQSGFYWMNPFISRKKISLKIRNFETGSTTKNEQKDATTGQVIQPRSRTHGRPSKVNDRDGNPVEISAVVV